jgi:carbohydrate kinase (thermoresistant glucokinase family)
VTNAAPVVLVVMGVSGSGKTTVARDVAARLGWPFQEGDDLHPAANVAKMRAGQPLDDEDRWPWLAAVAAWIGARLAAGQSGVITCSALRRVYRDRLRRPGVRFVHLHAPRDVLAARLAGRHGHYMPASLLDSQLATLEEPGDDEHPLSVDVSGSSEAAVEAILARLRETN